MAFEGLTERLQKTFTNLRKKHHRDAVMLSTLILFDVQAFNDGIDPVALFQRIIK